MRTHTFIVLPGGVSFETSDLDVYGDTSEAYFRAHLHAARQAAERRSPAWVVRDDSDGERYGFGPDAIVYPTTVLYQITQMGLASYWDNPSRAWAPLDLKKEDINTYKILEVVS